jgi:hypothetical protein
MSIDANGATETVVTSPMPEIPGVPREFAEAAIQANFGDVFHVEDNSTDSDKVEDKGDSDGASELPKDNEEGTDKPNDNLGDTETVVDPEKKDDPAQEVEEEILEFEDDVISGLKGDDLKKLPKAAQEAVAKFYSESTERQTKLETELATVKKSSESVQEMLKDPVIADRINMLKDGKKAYVDMRMTQAEKKSIIDAMVSKGLYEEDAKLSVEGLEAGLDNIVNDRVEAALKNKVIEINQNAENRRITETGRKNLFSLGEMHEDFKLNETDPNKFFDDSGNFNTTHHEYGVFIEKYGPVFEILRNKKQTWDNLSSMTPQQVYSMVALEKGLPVAFNTEARDKKIFKRGAAANPLRAFAKKTTSADRDLSVSPQNGNPLNTTQWKGIDLDRLNSDPNYAPSLYEKAREKGTLEEINNIAQAVRRAASIKKPSK